MLIYSLKIRSNNFDLSWMFKNKCKFEKIQKCHNFSTLVLQHHFSVETDTPCSPRQNPTQRNSLFEIDHRHFWMVWAGRIVLNVSVSTFSLFMIFINLGFKLTREGVSSVRAPRTSSEHQTLLKNGANLLNTKTVKIWIFEIRNFIIF